MPPPPPSPHWVNILFRPFSLSAAHVIVFFSSSLLLFLFACQSFLCSFSPLYLSFLLYLFFNLIFVLAEILPSSSLICSLHLFCTILVILHLLILSVLLFVCLSFSSICNLILGCFPFTSALLQIVLFCQCAFLSCWTFLLDIPFLPVHIMPLSAIHIHCFIFLVAVSCCFFFLFISLSPQTFLSL